MMLEALPLVHFWSVLLLKEQVVTSVRKTLKMLVWSVQNWSISSEICLENNRKISPFFPIAFWWSLPRKLLRNSHEIGRFFRDLSLKIPQNFTFSSAAYQKPWIKELKNLGVIYPNLLWKEPLQNTHTGNKVYSLELQLEFILPTG